MTVFVVGNATLDLSYRLPRLPAPGETLLASEKTVDCGGKGLNQAVAAARAGAAVDFFAAVGRDPAGAHLAAVLAAHAGLSPHLWSRAHPTDESIILVDETGENAIVSTALCASSVTPEEAAGALANARRGDLLVMQGNLSLAATSAALHAARTRGVFTILNPAPLAFPLAPLLGTVDLLVANEGEAAALGVDPLVGIPGTAVVVTLGARGCIGHAAGATFAVAAPVVVAIDTTGAGDAFVGTLAAALDRGDSLSRACELATEAGSIVVTRRGTYGAIAALEPLPKC